MTRDNAQRSPFILGAIRVEPTLNSLFRGDTRFPLEPRIVDVLCLLAEHAGEVVGRDTIIDTIWGLEHSGDESLTRAISLIRKTIRDAGEAEEYVETIPKRGYRIVQPVALITPEPPATAPDTTSPAPAPQAAAPAKSGLRLLPRIAVLVGAVAIVAIRLVIPDLFSGNTTTDASGSVITADASAPHTPSIAILPFTSLSLADEDRLFADGVAVSLLTRLGRITDLEVAGQRSSFAYRDRNLDLRTIGDELGVDHVLDGTVLRSGDEIRATIQLVRTTDGVQIWNKAYNALLNDVFAIQDDIVRQVGRQLEIELGVGRYRGRTSGEGIEPEAVEQYYLGLGHFGERMRNNEARLQAYDAFQNAVLIDPQFGEAWAGIAFVGSTSVGSPLSRNFDKFRRDVSHAFERAFALNANDASIHAAMVFWSLGPAFDMQAARMHAETALALAPAQFDVLYANAGLKMYSGDVEGGIDLYDRLMALQPESLSGAQVRARWLATAGRTEDAFAFFNACQAERCLGEGFVAFASTFAVLSGDPELAAQWRPHYEEFEAFLASLPPQAKPNVTRILPAFFSIMFDRPDKQEQVEALIELYGTAPVTEQVGMWAPVFSGLLPEEAFFAALELAADQGKFLSTGHALMPYYGTNPYPEWVLKHPRYRALFQRPELAEFARVRQAHGWTDGLPLSTE
ncbi:MAG: winged helix-turn-helix domain-containing protein [Pseudomonadota bacterium]